MAGGEGGQTTDDLKSSVILSDAFNLKIKIILPSISRVVPRTVC